MALCCFEMQPQLSPEQGRSYLQALSPHTLEQMDEVLRTQFERSGLIGSTVLGFCSAGICIRPDNRRICANCPYVIPLQRPKDRPRLIVSARP